MYITRDEFVRNVCGCPGKWSMGAFIEFAVADIRAQVGAEHVVLGLSGGVDSSVTAALIHKAIGPQLTCIFVDTGLMRKDEPESVRKLFNDAFKMDLCFIPAEARFLAKLAGVAEPEQKRKIIGAEFVDVFKEAALAISGASWLAQGTTYPDILESIPGADGKAAVKSHHNVGGLPEDLKARFKLLEPVAYLYKEEVREVGRLLGLPEHVVMRQPFPGPGLGVRHLGAVAKPTLDILREADAIVRGEIAAAGLEREVWQAFAVFLPARSVGVGKDGKRTYENAVALRVINSADGVTADWVRLPYDLLARISSRIIAEVAGVNRVVYDITAKPPGTIEWE